jgi:hypothetical protein
MRGPLWLFWPTDYPRSTLEEQVCGPFYALEGRHAVSELWPASCQLTSDQNVKTLFQNSQLGHMIATTMQGATTGLGGNYIVIDDPHKTSEDKTSKELEAQVTAYRNTLSTRHNDKKNGVTVIVMQRINDKDLSAHVLAEENDEGYVHLKLEAEAPQAQTITFPSGRIQTRKQGELL